MAFVPVCQFAQCDVPPSPHSACCVGLGKEPSRGGSGGMLNALWYARRKGVFRDAVAVRWVVGEEGNPGTLQNHRMEVASANIGRCCRADRFPVCALLCVWSWRLNSMLQTYAEVSRKHAPPPNWLESVPSASRTPWPEKASCRTGTSSPRRETRCVPRTFAGYTGSKTRVKVPTRGCHRRRRAS